MRIRPLLALLAAMTMLAALPSVASAATGDVTIANITVAETDETTSVDIEVVAEGPLQDGTVDWAVVLTDGESAADATDVAVPASGTVTIDQTGLFTTTGTFTVDILADDDLPEFDETFTIVLSNPTGGLTITDDTAVITIVDDDGGRLSVLDASLTEGDNTDVQRRLVVRIMLAEVVDHATIVDYDTADGTATEGEDYVGRPDGDRQEGDGTLTIPAGNDNGILDIRLNADSEQEGDETIIVTLSNPRADDETKTPIILRRKAVATILEDDGGTTAGGGGDGGGGTQQELTVEAGEDRTADSREIVAFEAALSNASSGATVTWDFGDGATDTGAEVTHAFSTTGDYDVTVTAAEDGDTATDALTVRVSDVAIATRSAGENREGTAVRVALDLWNTAPTVLLATSQNFPDALAAGPYAASLDAPLLLTAPDALTPAVASALRSLQTREVIILGGEGAVSAAVATQLQQQGLQVDRIQGDDRFTTAALLAREVGASRIGNQGRSVSPTAVVANGMSFPDALGAGAYNALDFPLPVLLSAATDVPDITISTLQALGVEQVLLLGGPVALSAEVEAELAAAGVRVTRLAGQDRYATSVRVAADALTRFGDTQARPVFVTGQNFPDGLAAGAVAGRIRGPVVLVPRDDLPTGTAQFLRSNADQLDHPVFLGGEVAITAANQRTITTALNATS